MAFFGIWAPANGLTIKVHVLLFGISILAVLQEDLAIDEVSVSLSFLPLQFLLDPFLVHLHISYCAACIHAVLIGIQLVALVLIASLVDSSCFILWKLSWLVDDCGSGLW